MIIITQLLMIACIMKGVNEWVRYLEKDPGSRTQKNFSQTIVKQSFVNHIKEKWTNEVLLQLTRLLACFIHFAPEKQNRMSGKLARAGITLSPEEYYARAFIVGILSLLLIPLIAIVGAPVFIPIGLGISGVLFYHFLTSYRDVLKKKKKEIELGLPGFIRSILYKLSETGTVSADLIRIFEDYMKIADPIFRYDVSVLVMEMKTKSIESALRNFNARLGIVEVSFLCNALLGITRGEHQENALAVLAKDMDLKARENLKRELEKRPGKVWLATIPLVAVGGITLLYVIISTFINNFSQLT